MAVEFTVPGAPVPKLRHRDFVNKRGIRIRATPPKTKSYQELVGWHARKAMTGRELFAGPLRVAVGAFLPIPPSWPKKKQARRGATASSHGQERCRQSGQGRAGCDATRSCGPTTPSSSICFASSGTATIRAS